MPILRLAFFFCMFCLLATCQTKVEKQPQSGLSLFINPSVTNADGEHEKEIINTWQAYLESDHHYRANNPFWHSPNSKTPDAFLWQLGLNKISDSDKRIQNNIIGVYPVLHDHYALKSTFSTLIDSTGQSALNYLITVYASKIDGQYKLVHSTDYHRLNWQNRVVGDINYYIHPEHQFSLEAATEMDSFNKKLADQFEMAPIKFDYFVANYSRDILNLMGYDFMPRSFQPMQSGGMAANYDNVIYAGNNSAYYPHEVVHLYTYAKFRNQYHSWVDEGVATLFGGSTGFSLNWHMQKLSIFLKENPRYPLRNLQKLQMDIPNGEFTTDFRYAIGGLVCKLIFEKEGMTGLFDALKSGSKDADYFRLLKDKLDIEKNEFEDFIRNEMKSYCDSLK